MIRTSLFSGITDPLDFVRGGSGGKPDVKTEEQKAEELKRKEQEQKAKEEEDRRRKEEKPKGKEKEEQIKELRQQKDALAAELDKLKKDYEGYEKLKTLMPFKDYLEKKYGKVDEEAVNNFIEKNKKRKKELEDLNNKYKEKESTLQEIEITKSDLWINDYARPLGEAQDALFADIVMIDKDLKPKHPELVTELHKKLVGAIEVDKDGKRIPPNAITVKKILSAFAQEYKEKTQEDYEIPKIADVVDNIKSIATRHERAINAHKNWAETVEEKNKEKIFDQSKREERDREAIITVRNKTATVVKDEFDYSQLEDIFPEEDVKKEFDTSHNRIIDIMRGKEKPTEYHEFLPTLVKANLFESLLTKYKSLEKQYEDEFKKKHSSVPSSSRRSEESSETKKLVVDDNDPLAFIKR